MQLRHHRRDHRPEAAVTDAKQKLDRCGTAHVAMASKDREYRSKQFVIRQLRGGARGRQPRQQRPHQQNVQAGGKPIAVAPAKMRGNQTARNAREQNANKHGHELRAHSAPAMLRRCNFHHNGNEHQPDRRTRAGDKARRRQHGNRGRSRHHCLGHAQYADHGDDEPALVDAIPQRHEQGHAHQHAAERQCGYPAHGGGARLKLAGNARQHGRLIMNAAGDHERRADQQRNQSALTGCRAATAGAAIRQN